MHLQAQRPQVKLRFRMLDGNWEGDVFCPCCEVVSVEQPPPPPDLQIQQSQLQPQQQQEEERDAEDELYCDLSWAQPGTLFDLVLSPLLTDIYADLNIQESAADFRVREYEGSQPLFALTDPNDDRPVVIACVVAALQFVGGSMQTGSSGGVGAWGSGGVPASASRDKQPWGSGIAGYGNGAPGSMYPGTG